MLDFSTSSHANFLGRVGVLPEAVQVVRSASKRFDLEHYFRFGKQRLL